MNTMENSMMSLWQTMLQLHRTFKTVLIGTLLAVGLAACGGGSDSPASTSTVPGAPTIGTATGGNAQATVSFTAPASNGGSAITGYTVTSSPGGVTATGTASPITVTGLSNGSSYTFTVHATNAVGKSVESGVSGSVTPTAPTVPGAPTIGTATAGNAQATVVFTAPASNGGIPINGYTVTSSPDGLTATGTASPIIVTGLTNGTGYTFTVIATNAIGGSVASAASNSVTPAVPTSMLTFSSGFAAGNLTVEGGTFTGYGGSDLDGWNCNGGPSWCGSGSTTTPGVAANASSAYFYYQTPTPAGGEYVGLGLMAPGVTALSTTADTSGIQITNQDTVNFTLNQNPEWYGNSNNNFLVQLTLGKYYALNNGGCKIQLRAVVTPVSVSPTLYSIPLSSFSVAQNCGAALAPTDYAAALALSPVSQIDFQGDSGLAALTVGSKTTSANTTTLDSATSTVYPTTVALTGGITFSIGGSGSPGGAGATPPTDPTVLPTAPSVAAGNVISVYGTHYGTMTGLDFVLNPGWGQGTQATEITVLGDSVWKLAKLDYQGIDLNPATGVDVSGMTNLHVDLWAATTTAVQVFLISPGPVEQAVTLNPTTAGWNSFDIPLSSYTTPVKTNIFQFKFVGTPAGNTVYIDNLYFWK